MEDHLKEWVETCSASKDMDKDHQWVGMVDTWEQWVEASIHTTLMASNSSMVVWVVLSHHIKCTINITSINHKWAVTRHSRLTKITEIHMAKAIVECHTEWAVEHHMVALRRCQVLGNPEECQEDQMDRTTWVHQEHTRCQHTAAKCIIRWELAMVVACQEHQWEDKWEDMECSITSSLSLTH